MPAQRMRVLGGVKMDKDAEVRYFERTEDDDELTEDESSCREQFNEEARYHGAE